MDYSLHHPEFSRSELQHFQRTDVIRAIAALAFSRKDGAAAAAYFEAHWPLSVSKDIFGRAVTKAAVAAGTSTDTSWAGPLVPATLVDAFVPLITAQSAVLQLPLRRVPFSMAVSRQTSDASYAWVGENKVQPVSKFAFSTTTLGPTKCSGIVIITKELARLATPGSVPAIQAALVDGLSNFVDTAFLDPASVAIAGQRPSSVTGSVAATVITGTTVSEKVAQVISAFYTALPQASPQSTLILAPATAGLLAATGQQPNLTVAGGTAFGLRVVTTPAATNKAVVVDPTRIAIARDEAPELDVSEHAAIESDSVPTDPPGASIVVVSLWALDLIGVRCVWRITWQPLPNAVQWAVVV